MMKVTDLTDLSMLKFTEVSPVGGADGPAAQTGSSVMMSQLAVVEGLQRLTGGTSCCFLSCQLMMACVLVCVLLLCVHGEFTASSAPL